jgi:hypothetical protein
MATKNKDMPSLQKSGASQLKPKDPQPKSSGPAISSKCSNA